MSTQDHLEGYRRKARELRIPESVAEWMLQLARPRIVLHRDGRLKLGAGPAAATAPIVGSVGGNPWLPEDVEWSGFPHYIASVDCGALPPDVLDFPFPHEGTLLFFGFVDEPDFTPDEADTCARIVYVRPGTPTVERTPDDFFRPFMIERIPLRYEIIWTMPRHESPEYLQLTGESRDLFDKYQGYEIGNEPWAYSGQLALGGHVAVIQNHPLDGLMPVGVELHSPAVPDAMMPATPHSMAAAAAQRRPDDFPLPVLPELPAPDAEWVTVAEMTEALPWIEPSATIYWSVRREDLAQQRFDRVKYHVDIM